MRRALLSIAACLLAEPALTQETASIQTRTVVSSRDLSVSTHKWEGKNLEVRNVHCFYADVGDYRCKGADSIAVVFFAEIQNEAGKQFIEANCDTFTKLASQGCAMTLRFRYLRYEEDTRGLRGRLEISADNAEIVLPAKRKAAR